MRAALTGALAAATLLLAACSGDAPSSAPDATPRGSTAAGDCPGSSAAADAWGSGVPADVPRLAGMHVTGGEATQGVEHVTFTAPTSFSDAVAFYLQQLPAAGYHLGTGDAEESEADIPFDKDGRQFSLKLRGVPDPCQTQGLLAIGAEPEHE